MKNLFHCWDDFTGRMQQAQETVLFLDYDGTLAPIAPTPVKAVLPQANRDLLKELAASKRCQVVIISGRALADVKSMVGIEGIVYIGNHGWEIEGQGLTSQESADPQSILAVGVVKNRLDRELNSIEGVMVEDKMFTLSVHYRLVPRTKVALVKEIFDEICEPYSEKRSIRVNPGKKVLEVRPASSWDKAKAAQWYLDVMSLRQRHGNRIAIYVGDDYTDEDAFAALRRQHLTVLVGTTGASQAEFFIKNQSSVHNFLKRMVRDIKDCQ